MSPPHLSLHWNSCLILVTPQLLWHLSPQMWLPLLSLLPSARGTLSGDQPSSWKIWSSRSPFPASRLPASSSLCHLPVASASPGPLLGTTGLGVPLRDGQVYMLYSAFSRKALYIPHNSVSQALLCMCLIFTVKKTNGQSDSPDTLEGWAPALPWQNLGMNSISDPRLYFLHNTPVVFKSP